MIKASIVMTQNSLLKEIEKNIIFSNDKVDQDEKRRLFVCDGREPSLKL